MPAPATTDSRRAPPSPLWLMTTSRTHQAVAPIRATRRATDAADRDPAGVPQTVRPMPSVPTAAAAATTRYIQRCRSSDHGLSRVTGLRPGAVGGRVDAVPVTQEH